MKAILVFFIFSVGLWSCNALSINFSGSEIAGGSPGPPQTDVFNLVDVNTEKQTGDVNICDFDENSNSEDSVLIELKLVHRLFRSDVIVPGVEYQGNVQYLHTYWMNCL